MAKRSQLGTDELAQRVALLRRFRELLVQQRERFHNYLAVLENQQTHIESGNAEKLVASVELEEQIVADIFSIQKVIDPLEKMYHMDDSDVSALKGTLDDLKDQVLARSAHNMRLLSEHMEDLRAEIIALRNNPLANASRSVYNDSGTASLIDIKG